MARRCPIRTAPCAKLTRDDRIGARCEQMTGPIASPAGAESSGSGRDRYEAVIGIEVHCQLRTASKMFCSCSTAYDGAPPNSHVCPVCLGLPGALPVINRRAVEHVLATGLAIEATHARRRPAGTARTTSTRTCRRATRSASTTCRSRRPAG